MKRKIVLLLFAVMITALFAGCGQESATQSDTVTAQDKEMVVAQTEVVNNFDVFEVCAEDVYGHMQVYDALVIRDKDGNIAPSLAEKYEISPDGKTITFYLRKGIKFTNGTEFKASDAKFTIDRASEAPALGWAMARCTGSDIVDDYTIKVNLEDPDVSFPEKLTQVYMVSEEAYKEYGDQYGKTVESTIGTGAYIVKEWQPGQSLTLEANPDYFAGEAGIKNVKLKTISDANAAVIALQTGEVALYMADIPGMAVDSLSENEKVTVSSFSSFVFMDVILNCETGPFTDVRLRQAVAYAIDRDKMFQVGTEGKGTITDYPGGPDYAGNPGIKSWYQTDLEKAKQLVKEAGMEGKTVTIKTQTIDPWPKLATSLQDDLNKIGLVAKVEQLELNAYVDSVRTNADYDIAISRYWSATKDMCEPMGVLESGGAVNYSRYSNPEIDPFLIKASAIMDIDERKQNYVEAIKIFTQDVPLIPLYYAESTRGYSKDLTIEEGNVQYDHIYYYNWK